MPDKTERNEALTFVLDWNKRAEKQQRQYMLLSIGAFIAAFAACILLFFTFQNQNYARIVNQNMKYVEDSAIQEANQLERQMEVVQVRVENLAEQYATIENVGGERSIEEKLALLFDPAMFDRIAYIAPDGKDTSLEGVADVGDRSYFQNAMAGRSGWEALSQSRVTGEPAVIFYAPIYEDGEIVGVMAGFYEQKRLRSLFSYELFNFEPTSYLILGDGTAVAGSEEVPMGGNVLAELAGKTFVEGTSIEAIRDAIADPDIRTITFGFVDEGKTSVGVVVEFQHSDWHLYTTLPDDVTSGMVNNANKLGVDLVVSIAVVFVLLIFALFTFFARQREALEREMGNASERLEAAFVAGEKQRSIIDSLGDAFSSVYYLDLVSGEYQRIKEDDHSAAAIPDTGSIAEGFGSYIREYVAEAFRAEMEELLDEQTLRVRLDEPGAQSVDYQRVDKKWRRGLLTPSVRDEDGRVLSAVFAVQQIDQEKAREQQAKVALKEAYEAAQLANSAKTSFLSNMSHDIRTPMNAIVGMTTIAAANIDSREKVADCLQKIASASRHLLGLINEVLDMSKIESGRVDLAEEEFSLSDIIDNLVTINQPLIREKKHTLTVDTSGLVHERVVGDATRLQQVFTNLLSNAVKYTPDGGQLSVTIRELESNKPLIGWYEVVFKDNGIGMSEEYLKTLFEPFTRAKDSRVDKIQGTGLGMPIARNIIRMMGGDIAVESRINEGSTFTVTFALRLSDEKEESERGAEAESFDFTGKRALLVEDNELNREIALEMLAMIGLEADWAEDGRVAVESFAASAAGQYDVILMDIQMPVMDGYEAARAIRALARPDAQTIPIIAMTANAFSSDVQDALAAGMNGHIAKPIDLDRMARTIAEHMG